MQAALTSSRAGSRARTIAKRTPFTALALTNGHSGTRCCASFNKYDRGSRLSRTQATPTRGCPLCGMVLGNPDTGAYQCSCTPARSALPIPARDGSWWPTPTGKANHFAPYMRRWPRYARFQDACSRKSGRMPSTFSLVLMGFPPDWIVQQTKQSETPSTPL